MVGSGPPCQAGHLDAALSIENGRKNHSITLLSSFLSISCNTRRKRQLQDYYIVPDSWPPLEEVYDEEGPDLALDEETTLRVGHQFRRCFKSNPR